MINTFAFPKLIYPLTVLDNPPAEYFNLINKSMYDFLWDKKPDKINRKTIIQNYENGGLKMIDLNIFIKSIKAGWVKRITNDKNNGDWKFIYLRQLEKVGGQFVFECNINEKDLNKTSKIKSKFLSEIVSSWSNINFTENIDNVKTEIIWNNSFIKKNNSTLYYKSWNDKRIRYIDQIFDSRHKVFYTFQHMKTVYTLENSDFLKYHTLIQCISHSWKVTLKGANVLSNTPKIKIVQQLSKEKSSNKFLYNIQLNKIESSLVIKPHIKWEQEINNIKWKAVHNIPSGV